MKHIKYFSARNILYVYMYMYNVYDVYMLLFILIIEINKATKQVLTNCILCFGTVGQEISNSTKTGWKFSMDYNKLVGT